MTLYYAITHQKEILRDPRDPNSWQIEDITALKEARDPEAVKEYINTIEAEDLYSYYLTVWRGHPENHKSYVLAQTNLEYTDQVNGNLGVSLDNGRQQWPV
jgi:hypothetical protein